MSDTPLWRRYLRLARPNVKRDVDDELEFHLEMRVAEYMRQGLSRDEARARAEKRFGEVGTVRGALVEHDRHREALERRREFFADFLLDLRFGWRALLRAPGFAVTAVLTLAIGIGANTAIFSVVDALLLRPLPYDHSEQLVFIGMGSAGEFLGLRERLHEYSEVAGFGPRQLSIDDGHSAAARLEGAAVTTNLFRTLRVNAALGSVFDDAAAIPANSNQIILSHGLWQTAFGGSRDAVGKRILVDGEPYTVVGVMPEEFRYPSATTQYWLPLAFNPANVGAHWGVGNGRFIGRIKSGVTLAQGLQQVRDAWPTMRRLNPLWDPGPQYGRNANPQSLQQSMVGAPRTLLWVLLGCVLLVLVIACVNVANLLLARATARRRELAVRAAVGGGRERLIRQLVTESLLLAVLGASLGVLFAVGAVRWMVSILPPGIPRVEEIAVNGTVLGVTAAVALLTGFVFGTLPALRATASNGSAMGGRRATHGAGHQRMSMLLVGAEVALAVLLVIGAQLLVRSFRQLRSVEPGFQSGHLIAARVTPPSASYRDDQKILAFYERVIERLRGVPGVTQVATVDRLPMATSVWGFGARIQGQFEDGSKLLPMVDHLQFVSPGYFSAMGIHVIHGRGFDQGDVDGSAPVAVISETMAKTFWKTDEQAVGKRLGYPWPSPWMTVVGVVPDVRQDSLRDTMLKSVYVPWKQRTRMNGSEMWVMARTNGDTRALAASIRSIVTDIDRSVPVSSVRSMDDILDASVQRDRFTMILVGLFATTALALGTVGIYGVMSYLVSQRTQEIGVRLALGATPRDVLGMVVKRGAVMAASGAAVGVVAAFWATRPLGALLYGVSTSDPLTYVAVPVMFILVAVAASFAPALRGTRVDPVKTLRAD